MNLFQNGMFKLASGMDSDFKIECDALTDDDWYALALEISKRVAPFGTVFGIPSGGDKLATNIRPFITRGSSTRLLVDDVYTTGGTIRKYRQRSDIAVQVSIRYRFGSEG